MLVNSSNFILNNVFQVLGKTERNYFIFLCILSLISAFLELISVASFIPFLSTIGNSDGFINSENSEILTKFLGLESKKEIIIFFAIGAFVFLLLSVSFRAFYQYRFIKFIFGQEYQTSSRLFSRYLGQEYSWYLNQHSAALGTNILSETSRVLNGVISPLLQLFSQSVLICAMLFLLFWTNFFLTLIIFLILGISYLFFYLMVKSHIEKLGKLSVSSNKMRYTISNETFSLIKEIKVYGIERVFEKKFNSHAYDFATSSSKSSIIGQSPRYIFEIIGFGGLLSIILFMRDGNDGFVSSLDTVGIYAIAGYKMLPAAQQIFYALAQLKFGKAALEALRYSFTNLDKKDEFSQNISKTKLEKSIELKNLFFKYPNSSDYTLKDINIKIPANKTIAFVGKTGSGKTTLVDILLGLHFPTSGAVFIDSEKVTLEASKNKSLKIGYVPQHVVLLDDSIVSNITLGADKNKIDRALLKKSISSADLDEFLFNELPNGLDTVIGENGLRLSGGQRQRLGIARALYLNPDVLVLDEATSALDSNTENLVLTSIEKLNGKMTIIIITHRIDTLQNVDNIFVMNKGSVVGSGTYRNLIKNNDYFITVSGKQEY